MPEAQRPAANSPGCGCAVRTVLKLHRAISPQARPRTCVPCSMRSRRCSRRLGSSWCLRTRRSTSGARWVRGTGGGGSRLTGSGDAGEGGRAVLEISAVNERRKARRVVLQSACSLLASGGDLQHGLPRLPPFSASADPKRPALAQSHADARWRGHLWRPPGAADPRAHGAAAGRGPPRCQVLDCVLLSGWPHLQVWLCGKQLGWPRAVREDPCAARKYQHSHLMISLTRALLIPPKTQ